MFDNEFRTSAKLARELTHNCRGGVVVRKCKKWMSTM